MRATLITLMLTVATQAGAACGNLCDLEWWLSATEADLQAELNAGADVMARTKFGWTPLHWGANSGTPANVQALLDAGAEVMARGKSGYTPLHSAALRGTSANVQALLDAGADAKAKDELGKTPWDLAQENKKLKDTKAYWALNDAQYN